MSSVRIVAADVSAERRAVARSLGADVVVDPAADGPASVHDVSGGGAVLVMDLVGSDATLAFGAGALRAGGELVLVGVGEGSLPFSFLSMPYECSLSTAFWGDVTELREVVALAQAGHLTVDAELIVLDDTADAYRRLEAGELSGSRAIVTPGS